MSQEAQPRQLTRKEQMDIVNQRKERMMPLVKFMKKHGLKLKHATFNRARVEYFRMDNFQAIVEEQKQRIQKNTKLKELVETVNKDLFFMRRPPNTEKLRYPKTLIPAKTQENGKFACFKFDTAQSMKLYFILFLFVIFAGVMFPLWPYELKYGVWIISLTILTTLVGILVLRLVLYVIFASFGVSFWMFPNLMGDYGVLDSFKPFYSVQKWENDCVAIILRVLAFALFIYYSASIYQEPELYIENLQITKETFKQVHDWGVGKIKGEAANFSQRALTMDKIINETADAFEQPSSNKTQNQQTQQQQSNPQQFQGAEQSENQHSGNNQEEF